MSESNKLRQYRMVAAWVLTVLATAALYTMGLGGSFLFDDLANLAPFQHWVDGRLSLSEAVFGNHSGPFGRSLTMATFALNAAIGGAGASSFKVGNIVVHCISGLAVGWLAFRVFMLDKEDRSRAAFFAWAVAAVWMLHSSQVTTVLYPVQRMAQLAMLLVTLSLVAFSAGLYELGRNPVRARLLIYLIYPLIVGLALLAKENSAVSPLVAIGIYFAFWGRGYSGDRALRLVLAVVAAAGLMLVLYLLIVQPAVLFDGYSTREFTMGERLYTQILAVCDYLVQAVVPAGSGSALYFDDYQTSRGLISPPATLLCLIALSVMVACSILLRKKAPIIMAGLSIFFGGHAVESSFLPLELYFEHRNYLPSVGIYIALFGFFEFVLTRFGRRTDVSVRIALVSFAAYIGVISFSTALRASVWKDDLLLLAVTAEARPDSYRANVAALDIAIRRNNSIVARAAVDRMIASSVRRTQAHGYIGRVVLDCLTKGVASEDDLRYGLERFPVQLNGADVNVMQLLRSYVAGNCDVPSAGRVASAIETVAAREAPKDHRHARGPLLAALAAESYLAARLPTDAARTSKWAWDVHGHPVYGAIYAKSLAMAGDVPGAIGVLKNVKAAADRYPLEAQDGVADIERQINSLKNR